MATTEERKSLLGMVDLIHNRFMECMIIGQRDAMFAEIPVTPKTESDDARLESYSTLSGELFDSSLRRLGGIAPHVVGACLVRSHFRETDSEMSLLR
jgi:hypothetical protein